MSSPERTDGKIGATSTQASAATAATSMAETTYEHYFDWAYLRTKISAIRISIHPKYIILAHYWAKMLKIESLVKNLTWRNNSPSKVPDRPQTVSRSKSLRKQFHRLCSVASRSIPDPKYPNVSTRRTRGTHSEPRSRRSSGPVLVRMRSEHRLPCLAACHRWWYLEVYPPVRKPNSWQWIKILHGWSQTADLCEVLEATALPIAP